MFEFLSHELREGLERARKKASPRARKLAVHWGDAAFPIRRLWSDGFAIDVVPEGKLRGFVEVHEGARHIMTCLIQAIDVEGDELICSFKRSSVVSDHVPLDYVRDDGPQLYLPRQ